MTNEDTVQARDAHLEEFLREIAACGVAWRRLPAVERALNTYLLTARVAPPAGVEAMTWPKARETQRSGDMAPAEQTIMRVGLDSDNDVYVNVWNDERDKGASATIEFCNGGGGGGKSPHTRIALVALMVAMEKDADRVPLAAAPPQAEQQTAWTLSEDTRRAIGQALSDNLTDDEQSRHQRDWFDAREIDLLVDDVVAALASAPSPRAEEAAPTDAERLDKLEAIARAHNVVWVMPCGDMRFIQIRPMLSGGYDIENFPPKGTLREAIDAITTPRAEGESDGS